MKNILPATPFGRALKHTSAAFLAGSVAAAALTSCAQPREVERPNVLIFLTDDQGYGDMGVYGSTDISTPNMDRLAEEGLRFTQFYTASPVCTPSRAGLLTGSYPKRIGMGRGVFYPNDQKGMNPDEITIADMLQGADYETMAIGKWHLGRPDEVLPTSQGFDHYYGVPYSNDMTPDHFYQQHLGGPWPALPLMEDTQVIDTGTDGFGVDQTQLTRLYTERAIDFIETERDEPFFLYLAYNQPHYPNIYGEDFIGVSDRGKYGDAVEELDWSVGEIMQALEDSGLDENTLVIFTSDNGPWRFVENMPPDQYGSWSSWSDGTTGSALPLDGWKTQTLEGGQRVPFIVRFPGVVASGEVTDAMASNIDLLPTIADYAGIDISGYPAYDGKSIRAVLERPGRNGSPQEYFLYYDGDGLVLRAIRNADGYKLQMLDEDENFFQVNRLYYLPDDIHTDNDISSEHPEIVDELLAAAREFDAEISANIRPQWTGR